MMTRSFDNKIRVTGILLFATLLRAWDLSSRSLWFDEAIEYWMAVIPLSQISENIASAIHDPPLYTYFLHGWVQLGISEFWLRLPSVYFSLLAIVGMVVLGNVTQHRKAGMWGALLLAVSVADVRYAQEVGQYALLVTLTVWNLITLYLAFQQDRWRDWGVWAGLSLIGFYTHYGFAIIAFTTALPIFLYNVVRWRKTAVARQFLAGIGLLVGIVPLFIFIIPNQMSRLGASRSPIHWPSFFNTSSKILAFPFVGNFASHAWPWPSVSIHIISLILLALLLIALVKLRSITHPLALLIISWFGYYLISRTGSYFFLPTRHSLLLLPLIVFGLGIGIAVLNTHLRHSGTVFAFLLVGFSLIFPKEWQEDNRTATAYWLANHSEGEPTYIYYGASVGFRYQLDRQTSPHLGLPPAWYLDCLSGLEEPYCSEFDIYYGEWIRGASNDEIRDSVFSLVGVDAPRVWLYFSHVNGDEQEQFVEALSNSYQFIEIQEFENAAIMLLEKQ